MQVKILKSFSLKLARQNAYITADKPQAARKFKNDLLANLEMLSYMPYKNKKSIYFNDANIRDLIFKGYTIVYRIKPEQKVVEVFGLIKYEEKI
ncbi:MAG: type II toxin-antitoxin system RelE/ParE family toxin [Gelidibacter sp.]